MPMNRHYALISILTCVVASHILPHSAWAQTTSYVDAVATAVAALEEGTPSIDDLGAYGDSDCNANGITDALDISNCPPGEATCADCNANGSPDECDIAACLFGEVTCTDCNANGIPDECDIANCPPEDVACQDCNGNGVPDACEVVGARELAKLTASDAGSFDKFGESLALSGGIAVMGTPDDSGPAGTDQGSVYLFDVSHPDSPIEMSKLHASDATSDDAFGVSVAVSAGLALIGAQGDDGTEGNNQGSAYLFDVGDPSDPVELAKLSASDAAEDDLFGRSVALSSGLAIVGAYLDDGPAGTDQGSAYLFDVNDPSNPVELAKLIGSDAAEGDWFGRTVALNGNVALVGAHQDDGTAGKHQGSAYLFDVTDPANPVQLAKLTASDAAADDRFGRSVALASGVAIIGASGDDGPAGFNQGSAYLFDVSDPSDPIELAKVVSSDAEESDAFGASVSLHGQLALVGAYLHDTPAGDAQGAAYLFDIRDPRNPVQRAKLTGSDAAQRNWFGQAVSLGEGLALVNARDQNYKGAAYLFDVSAISPDCNSNGIPDHCELANCTPTDLACQDCNGNSIPDVCEIPPICATCRDCNVNGVPDACDIADCPEKNLACQDCNGNGSPDECELTGARELAKLTASDGRRAQFGRSVSVSGDLAVAGANIESGLSGSFQGSAYLFDVSDPANPTELSKLTASDAAADDEFGISVSTSNGLALIGAWLDDGIGGFSQGSAYLFDVRDPTEPVELAKLTASDAADVDFFGYSVALEGGLALVGAFFHDGPGGIYQGSAYLFDVSDPANPVELARLTASDGAEDDRFGITVALSGGLAMVGASSDDGPAGVDQGSAYLFDLTDPANPVELAKLTTSDAAADDHFAASVSLSGRLALIGSHLNNGPAGKYQGSAYLFDLGDPSNPLELSKLTASDGTAEDLFGRSVCLSGDLALVGAYLDDGPGGVDQGSAYLFDVSDPANPVELTKLNGSDAAADDFFGFSASLNDGLAFVGAYRADEPGVDIQGSAYLYDVSTFSLDCNSNDIPDDCDIARCAPENSSCQDSNGNSFPDECECPPIGPVATSPQPVELTGSDDIPRRLTANRFLTFTAGDRGRTQAIRVTLTNLPPPFDVWNGVRQWVSAPTAVAQASAEVDPAAAPAFGSFQASRLECPETPHCMDWSTVGPINVFGEAIVPSLAASNPPRVDIPAAYDIQVIDCVCDRADGGSYSATLDLTQPVWGDTVSDLAEDPPLPSNGPPVDVVDTVAIIERFSNASGAISKTRADMEPNCLDLTINVADVLSSIRGFSGLGYNFTPTAPDPCNSTCPNPLP